MDTVKRVVGDVDRIYVEYDDHEILGLEVLTGTGSVWANARLDKIFPSGCNEWFVIDRDSRLDPPRRMRAANPQEYIIGLGTALCALIRTAC